MPVGRLLVQLGFVSERHCAMRLSEKLGLQSVDLGRIIVDPGALKLLPRDWRGATACPRRARPPAKSSSSPSPTPTTSSRRPAARALKGEFEVELRLAGDTEIDRAIDITTGTSSRSTAS